MSGRAEVASGFLRAKKEGGMEESLCAMSSDGRRSLAAREAWRICINRK